VAPRLLGQFFHNRIAVILNYATSIACLAVDSGNVLMYVPFAIAENDRAAMHYHGTEPCVSFDHVNLD